MLSESSRSLILLHSPVTAPRYCAVINESDDAIRKQVLQVTLLIAQSQAYSSLLVFSGTAGLRCPRRAAHANQELPAPYCNYLLESKDTERSHPANDTIN